MATRRGSILPQTIQLVSVILLNAFTHPLTRYRRVWARARVRHARTPTAAQQVFEVCAAALGGFGSRCLRRRRLTKKLTFFCIFDHGSVAYLSIPVKTTLRNHHHVVRWCVAYIPGRCNLVWADRTRRHDVFHSLCILWTIVLHGAMTPIHRLYPKNILCELLI